VPIVQSIATRPGREHGKYLMKIFEAQVRIPNGAGTSVVKTRVMAETSFKARLLLEHQYGRNNVIGAPRLVP